MGGDEHPSPGGGPKAAHGATPRCRLGGIGMSIHVAHPPTCPRDVIMEQLHPLYTYEVLLWGSHVSQCEHNAQGGIRG